MAIVTMILGKSGTGKSTSMRNLSGDDCFLIQAIEKPLPFRSNWTKATKDAGNVFCTDLASKIINAMHAVAKNTQKKIIIIDDFQYVMANEFMRSVNEKGYDKFTRICADAWNIINQASLLPSDMRVYILSHSEESELGEVKAKTIGKMMDDKITLEGLFTTVLRTEVRDGEYNFLTKNNGRDTVKSPMGLFEAGKIENDLKAVDAAICEYYNITTENQGV